MLNTLIATSITLRFGENHLRLDAIGTHLVENAIGIARMTSSDPRWTRILTTYSHSELKKKLARKYCIHLHVHGRVNDGGCKIDQPSEESTKISKPKDWSVPNAINFFRGLCNPKTSEELLDEL